MIALARKTVLYQWRQFLPALLSVAFAALLLIVQSALLAGIFQSASIPVHASKADIWLASAGTQSVDLGNLLANDAQFLLMRDSRIRQVEGYRWLSADWRAASLSGTAAVVVSAIATAPESLMFANAISTDLRATLRAPDTVLVDRADAENLGAQVGAYAVINGHRVQVVGLTSGLRALGGASVLCSLQTAQRIDPPTFIDHRVNYFVAALASARDAESTLLALQSHLPQQYKLMGATDFAAQTERYWMWETGAGVGYLFLGLVVLLVGVVITAQALSAAINASIKEYVMLQALGVSARSLGAVVLEQAGYIGAAGALLGALLSFAIVAIAQSHDVPMALDWFNLLCIVTLCILLSVASGLWTLRGIHRAELASLLR